MASIKVDEVKIYVQTNIESFHAKRLERLQSLRLDKILQRKNPYLFKAKNILTAQDLVKTLLDAHLSSQEETIFGDFLEGLAIFINQKVYGGRKSSAEGNDLEFCKDKLLYIVSIKSGPNWGNSSQVKKMRENFNKAKKILHTSNSKTTIIAINGCCYGRNHISDKGDYYKYCGQKFWEFISGDKNLYIQIIKPLGHQAKEKNDEFIKKYAAIINEFTYSFMQSFCIHGDIDWNLLVQYNSASEKPKKIFIVPTNKRLE